MARKSKYGALKAYLNEQDSDEITLTVNQIVQIIQQTLPSSAAKLAWWSNRKQGGAQANAWLSAGYEVVRVDLDPADLNGSTILFRRPGLIPQVKRRGDTIMWDADLVKALRYHMNASQADLADEMGVRQQTISEWEIGAYEPRKSTSKYLMLIAKKVGFAQRIMEQEERKIV